MTEIAYRASCRRAKWHGEPRPPREHPDAELFGCVAAPADPDAGLFAGVRVPDQDGCLFAEVPVPRDPDAALFDDVDVLGASESDDEMLDDVEVPLEAPVEDPKCAPDEDEEDLFIAGSEDTDSDAADDGISGDGSAVAASPVDCAECAGKPEWDRCVFCRIRDSKKTRGLGSERDFEF